MRFIRNCCRPKTKHINIKPKVFENKIWIENIFDKK